MISTPLWLRFDRQPRLRNSMDDIVKRDQAQLWLCPTREGEQLADEPTDSFDLGDNHVNDPYALLVGERLSLQ